MEVCEICGKSYNTIQGLSTHLVHKGRKIHNITVEEYYVKYKMIDEKEPYCPTCGRKKNFRTLGVGYAHYCDNLHCIRVAPKTIEKRIKTNIDKYGETSHMKCDWFKDKLIEYNLNKYGVKWSLSRKDVIEKRTISYMNAFLDSLFDQSRLGNKIKPLFDRKDYIGGHKKKYKWECLSCNTVFESYIENGQIPRCPTCFPYNMSTSKPEKEISDFIKNLGFNVIENDRSVLKCRELDIYIPSHNLAVEFDGLYWHSEANGISKNYHINKTNMCNCKGIRLIHVFEDEWYYKSDIVKSIIKAKLNIIDEKIYARKCSVSEIINKQDAKAFLDKNHIQGKINGTHYGLYYNNELICILTLGKSRFCKDGSTEILRFCSKINTVVIGGLSRLLKFAINKASITNMITYADLRYGDGKGYEICGFTKKKTTPPSFFYTNHVNRFSRLSFQKHMLKDKLKNYDPLLTAKQNMALNGFHRIWDCGTISYTWKGDL